MKKHTIKGFGQPYIDDDVNPKEEKAPEFSLEEKLVTLIWESYEPVNNMAESTEQKSTLDLIEEMGSSADVDKNRVVKAMEDFGFKLHYTGFEYVWLMKERKK